MVHATITLYPKPLFFPKTKKKKRSIYINARGRNARVRACVRACAFLASVFWLKITEENSILWVGSVCVCVRLPCIFREARKSVRVHNMCIQRGFTCTRMHAHMSIRKFASIDVFGNSDSDIVCRMCTSAHEIRLFLTEKIRSHEWVSAIRGFFFWRDY